MSIKDIIDSHKSKHAEFEKSILQSMSRNFESQLEKIVESILSDNKNGFAIIIQREYGDQNDPENPWLTIDNSVEHIRRVTDETNYDSGITITTKQEMKEINRLLQESGIEVTHVFVHNLKYDFPEFRGDNFVDPDGDDNLKILNFPDQVFNAFWKNGVELFTCKNGEINTERKWMIRFRKENTLGYWDANHQDFNHGRITLLNREINSPDKADWPWYDEDSSNYWESNKYSLLFCKF